VEAVAHGGYKTGNASILPGEQRAEVNVAAGML